MKFTLASGSVNNRIVLILLFTFALLSCNSKKDSEKESTQEEIMKTGVYLKKVFESDSGNLNYRLLYPAGFKTSEKYPVLLFLHGAGERGNDNKAQLKHGGDLLKEGMKLHKGIVIVPQCPKEDYWIENLDVPDRADGIRNFEPDVAGPPSKALTKVM